MEKRALTTEMKGSYDFSSKAMHGDCTSPHGIPYVGMSGAPPQRAAQQLQLLDMHLFGCHQLGLDK
jgi:hypothetical protein